MKKTLTIPLNRFCKDDADKYDFPYAEKGEVIILNVADLVKWPTTADLLISCYYVGQDHVMQFEDGQYTEEVYHFSEHNCCHERHAFENNKVLCVGEGKWHLPGNCKINKTSPYKAFRRR